MLLVTSIAVVAFFAEPKERERAYDSRRVHKHAEELLLSKSLGVLVDLAIEQLGLPAELGGLLVVTLFVSALTFGGTRTNVL
jgi:hypothetical protein